MKLATPVFEDLVKVSLRYKEAMDQANVAAAAFVDAMSKVAPGERTGAADPGLTAAWTGGRPRRPRPGRGRGATRATLARA